MIVPENNTRITEEQIVRLLTFLVDQMGGSVVIDSFDWMKLSSFDKTINLETRSDPWSMTVRVVDPE